MSYAKSLDPAQSEEILRKVSMLLSLYQSGKLGGAVMPEDSNPGYPKEAKENYTYLTLPMALNYQRNSYKLWEAAKETAGDPEMGDPYGFGAEVASWKRWDKQSEKR